MWRIVVLLFVSNAFTPTTTLPQGAPESVCDTLLPFHGGGIRPMTTVSPFSIVPTASAVGQGQILTVEIRSVPPELRFGGFMLHARTTSPPYKVIGRFAPSIDGLVKLINCDGVDNTATHVSPSPKGDIGLQWQAPNDFLGEVVFNATIAQEYDKFWVGLESTPVQVVQRGAVIPPTTGISTTRRPVASTVPAYVPQIKATQLNTDSIYEGCGSTKNCFGTPNNCVTSQNCQGMVTVEVIGGKFHFELKSIANNVQYIAVGISTDDRMGNDAGMECIPENGDIRAYSSYVTAQPLGATRQQVPQNVIRLQNSSFVDGVIYCKIERDAVTTILGKEFDLINNKYHLLVALGSSVRPDSVDYHDQRLASSQAINLGEVQYLRGRSVLLFRLHGAFMLVAWIGAASAGILLARYFKQTWVGSSLCGKDQWFAWHRFFMIATWALTIAGFVIIFVELRGWSAADNPHAILGTVTTILCFIQPFMALFRPGPTDKNRPIFNWAHWFVGNAAHLLAIVTIFFAVQLTAAQLPSWYDWILVAFVAFHVVMHFVFSIAGCVSDQSSARRVNSFPMTDVSPRNSVKDQQRKVDAPYAGLRKGLLAIYLIILSLFVIASVVIAVLAPIGDTVRSLQSDMQN